MEIIKHDPGTIELEALQSLPANYQYFVKLRSESPCSKYSDLTLKAFCAQIIKDGWNFITPPDKKNEFTQVMFENQTQELFKLVRGDYGTVTISEVRECFKIGLNGEFGHFMGMCPLTYSKFLKGWVMKPERSLAYKAYLDKIAGWKLAEKPELPRQFFYDACERAYKRYRDKGEMPEVPFCLYDTLVEYTGQKTLILKEDLKEIINQGKINYHKKIRHSSLKDVAKDWKLVLDKNDPDFNNVFANSVKEVATEYFFKRLVSFGNERIL